VKSVESQRISRHYIPEDNTLHNHRCENMKHYNFIYFRTSLDDDVTLHATGNICP
jgi:hypothetical protein